jgi:hypothetical protein
MTESDSGALPAGEPLGIQDLERLEALLRFLEVDPATRTPEALWKRLPASTQRAMAQLTLEKHRGTYLAAALTRSLAEASKTRIEVFARKPVQDRLRALRGVPLAQARLWIRDLLAQYLLSEHRAMLEAYLDGMGVPHNEGFVEDDFEGSIETEAALSSAAALLDRFGLQDVALYLTFMLAERSSLVPSDVGLWLSGRLAEALPAEAERT